jgi:hypothetical protein
MRTYIRISTIYTRLSQLYTLNYVLDAPSEIGPKEENSSTFGEATGGSYFSIPL